MRALRKLYHIAKEFLSYKPKVQLKDFSIIRPEKAGFFHAAFADKILPAQPLVYSFGIGEEATFELELIEKHNAQVYAFDPTPKSIQWVKNNINNPNFHFFPYGLSDKNEFEKFHLPENPDYVSGSIINREGTRSDYIEVEMKNLATLMQELGHKKIDLLKLDVQGSEFKAVPNILESGVQFTQLCIGIYFRFLQDGTRKAKALIYQLTKKNCAIIYAYKHWNNMELTFLQR